MFWLVTADLVARSASEKARDTTLGCSEFGGLGNGAGGVIDGVDYAR